jgi:putative membrane protein
MHPFALLSEAINAARALALPALVGGASIGGGHMGRMVLWGLGFLAVSTLLFAVAEYLALQYRLTDDELILDSGVLGRRHRVIPLSRVQNLELRQSTLQRAFSVAELRVDTAGGDTEDPVALVLGHAEAQRLRAELLQRRVSTPETEAEPTISRDLLARLSARDLVLAGVTANEAGVLAAVLVGVVEAAYQLPLGIPRMRLDPRVLIADLPLLSTLLLGLALLLVLLSLALLFSIGGALVGYWDFVLERVGSELRKGYGAFDRREVTVPLARVQALRIEESLLRRPLGLASLKIETAGAAPGKAGRGGAEAFLPLVRVREVPRLAGAIFDGFEYRDLVFRPAHPYARKSTFFRYAALVLALATGAAVWLGAAASWFLLLLILAYVAAHAHYRTLAHARVPGYIVSRSGFWNRITWIVPEPKVQTVHLIETLFQRRSGVATPVVDTAAGQVPIVNLACDEALLVFREIAERATSPGRRPTVSGGESAGPRERQETAAW